MSKIPHRYLVFAGSNNHYPNGGWDDLRESFHTLNQAKQKAESLVSGDDGYMPLGWYHIVDVESFEVVERS